MKTKTSIYHRTFAFAYVLCVPCMSSAPTTVGVNKFQKYKYLFNNQRFWVT